MLPGDPAQLRRQVPVGRLGHPSEVADLSAAILANAHLTNQVISLDGGIHPSVDNRGDVQHGVRG